MAKGEANSGVGIVGLEPSGWKDGNQGQGSKQSSANAKLEASATIVEEPLVAVTLPIELTNNNSGRTIHFGRSVAVRKRVESLLRSLGHVYDPLDFPVWIRLTRLMGPRRREWDVSSWGRGNWKEIEDSLVACGWFHDDGPKWITEIRFRQMRAAQTGIIIELFRSE